MDPLKQIETTRLKLPLRIKPRIAISFEVVDSSGSVIATRAVEQEAYDIKKQIEAALFEALGNG